MAATKSKPEPYPFAPEFERAVVWYTCCHPRFYGRIGFAVDPDALNSEPARDAVAAAHAVADDMGHGPELTALVIQRMRRWMHEGKVTWEQILAVNQLLEMAEDAGVPPEESVRRELTPILRRRMENEALKEGMAAYAKKTGLGKVIEIARRAETLGINDLGGGVLLADAFEEIGRQKGLDRLATGIIELDLALGGGVPRGEQAVWAASEGTGKSQALCQVATYGAFQGKFTGVASLELPRATWLARIMANATGIPINTILENAEVCRPALEQIRLAPMVVEYFTPKATTPEDLFDWVKRCEDREGRKLELLVVDIADKMTTRGALRKEQGEYRVQGDVYETLRRWAEENGRWNWTGSQNTGRADERKAKRPDLEHVADSKQKSRAADKWITLRYDDETKEMELFLAKNRTGEGRRVIGPLPTDLACARIAPVSYEPLHGEERQRRLEQAQARLDARETVDALGDLFDEPGAGG